MSLLKKDNWFINLILMIFAPDIYVLLLAYMLDLFDKDAWYSKWQYWVFGAICLIFPVFIMFMVLEIEMLVKVCQKLKIAGEEIYASPYTWIILFIIPVIGWILLVVMYLYLKIFTIVAIYNGEGENYIK